MKSIGFIILVLYSLFSDFTFEIITSSIIILAILQIFRFNKIPIGIQFYFGILILQIIIYIPYWDLTFQKENQKITDLEIFKEIIIVSLFQILLMVITFSKFFKNNIKITLSSINEGLSSFNFKKLLYFYLFMSFIFPLIFNIFNNNPSLIQLFRAAAMLKDFVLIIFCFHFFLRKERKILIFLILMAEFLLGFISYFSSFKIVIFYLIITILTLTTKINLRKTIITFLLFLSTILVMSYWSYIKGDYREYLRAGEISQNVNVDNSSASQYLLEGISSFTFENLVEGFNIFLGRVQYIDQYKKVKQNVPLNISYQYGSNTLESIDFVTSIRALSSNKKSLDPSLKTAKYTNTQVASAAQGTSISMGFFSDFYIDFGSIGMIIPLMIVFLLLGLFLKSVYSNKKYNTLFNLAMLIAIVTHIGTFESDLSFYLGILRNYIVVYFIFDIFLLPRIFKYLVNKPNHLILGDFKS